MVSHSAHPCCRLSCYLRCAPPSQPLYSASAQLHSWLKAYVSSPSPVPPGSLSVCLSLCLLLCLFLLLLCIVSMLHFQYNKENNMILIWILLSALQELLGSNRSVIHSLLQPLSTAAGSQEICGRVNAQIHGKDLKKKTILTFALIATCTKPGRTDQDNWISTFVMNS